MEYLVYENCLRYAEARSAFAANPTAANARAWRLYSNRCLQAGGSPDFPTGYPDGCTSLMAIEQTAGVMKEWLATREPGAASRPVTVTIDSNRLVHILNSVRCVPGSEQWQVIETLREALMPTA